MPIYLISVSKRGLCKLLWWNYSHVFSLFESFWCHYWPLICKCWIIAVTFHVLLCSRWVFILLAGKPLHYKWNCFQVSSNHFWPQPIWAIGYCHALSGCPIFHLSVCLSVCLSLCMYVCMSFCPSIPPLITALQPTIFSAKPLSEPIYVCWLDPWEQVSMKVESTFIEEN